MTEVHTGGRLGFSAFFYSAGPVSIWLFFGYTYRIPVEVETCLIPLSIPPPGWSTPALPPVAGGALLVYNGTIAATGTLAELKAHYSAPVVDHHDSAILPGFVNAHTHLELTHFPSWRLRTHVDYNPRRFSDWIIQLIKITRGLQADDFRSSLVEGLRKCAESGTTAVGDILTRYDLLSSYGMPPLSGRVYFEALGHDPGRYGERLNLALSAAASMTDSHLQPGLSPHAPYTTGEANMGALRDAASSHGLPLSVHISESRAESDFIFDSSGPLADDFYPFVDWQQYLTPPRRCSSTELLDRNGLLTPATLAVHCVHLTLADAQILKERGVTVCLCPRSNDRLDVGRAPLHLFRKLGIPLALGTDSLASNDSISLWDEMRFALEAFPQELTPEDVFRMATSGGAAALGLSGLIGSLEPGKRADFQVVRHAGQTEKGSAGAAHRSGATGRRLHRRSFGERAAIDMNSLENAIVRLLRNKPFYGHFLLNLRRSQSPSSRYPAGVTVRDGIATLSIDPPRFAQYSDPQQEALLEHLIKHLLHLHPLRRKGRNSHDWDVCCDLAINPTVEGLPEDALLPEMYDQESGLAAEEYYDLLVPPFDAGNLEGSGYGDSMQDQRGSAGQGRAALKDAATLDDHEIWI